jgi:hypothetical protein
MSDYSRTLVIFAHYSAIRALCNIRASQQCDKVSVFVEIFAHHGVQVTNERQKCYSLALEAALSLSSHLSFRLFCSAPTSVV